jgi:hypothetical protein
MFSFYHYTIGQIPIGRDNEQSRPDRPNGERGPDQEDASGEGPVRLDRCYQGGLAKGERVVLPGIGTFSCVQRNARTGRDPRTGKEISIPSRTVVKFLPAAAVKKQLNSAKKWVAKGRASTTRSGSAVRWIDVLTKKVQSSLFTGLDSQGTERG